jgi:hypothetical protein
VTNEDSDKKLLESGYVVLLAYLLGAVPDMLGVPRYFSICGGLHSRSVLRTTHGESIA